MGFMLWCPTYEHNSNTNPTQALPMSQARASCKKIKKIK